MSAVYGPHLSRRLGLSLGVDLFPLEKICSFNCVYCECDPTQLKRYPTIDSSEVQVYCDEVLDEVKGALERIPRVDFVTISGCGEPTLHPEFYRVVEELKVLLMENFEARLAVLSNSSTLTVAEVREALKMVDLPVLKLDAGSEEFFKMVNMPYPGISLDEIVDQMRKLCGENPRMVVQTMLLRYKGLSNASGRELELLVERIAEVKPSGVQLYVPYRSAWSPSVTIPSSEELMGALKRIQEAVGERVEVKLYL